MKSNHEKILLLKVSDASNIPFGNPDELRKRASGSWKISVDKLWNVKRVFLLLKQQIIAEYTLGSTFRVDKKSRRVSFDLTPVEDSDVQNLPIHAPTSNPASTLDASELKKQLKDGEKDQERRLAKRQGKII